jgi:hypothetical protein
MCIRDGKISSMYSFTAFTLPGRVKIRVFPAIPATLRLRRAWGF